jgi:acetyl-CoA carboxylase biotin carboxyl carrier protein
MVGTFYRAPSPEAAAYVEAGQIIEPGQIICIIEAMKLMNEIKSEIKGKIIEILADNAEPVEFGQPMFLIEPL